MLSQIEQAQIQESRRIQQLPLEEVVEAFNVYIKAFSSYTLDAEGNLS